MCPAQKILSTHTTPVNRRREQVPCSFRTRCLKTVQTPYMRTYIHTHIYIYIYIFFLYTFILLFVSFRSGWFKDCVCA